LRVQPSIAITLLNFSNDELENCSHGYPQFSPWFVIMKFVTPSILVAVTIGICTFAPSAQALDYESKSGFTTLSLAEGSDNFRNTGHYLTKVGNGNWGGFIKITEGQGAMGHYYYKGTFLDSPLSEVRVPPNSRTTCTGDIDLVRSMANGRSNRMNMAVTWKVTGGRNCQSIGKMFQMNLSQK
jgi:hypothetical protein